MWVPPPAPAAEFAWLAKTYGPGHHSEFLEEWIVRDVFHDCRSGVFLDVGAADFKEKNNTYYLEANLGWSGIAIDAMDYAAGYRAARPQTRFFRFFVSDRSDDVVEFYELKRNNAASSGDKAFVDRFGETPTVRRVETITLDRLLDSAGVPHVDFVSLDIELGEPKALAGFDIRRFQPSLVCVEAHAGSATDPARLLRHGMATWCSANTCASTLAICTSRRSASLDHYPFHPTSWPRDTKEGY